MSSPGHREGRSVRVSVRRVQAPEEYVAARRLLRQYHRYLATHRDVTPFDDAILRRGLERFDAEIRGFPGEYGPPTGRFLIAWRGSIALGCAAVRRQAEGVAEIKRVYVRPGARGAGVGYRLTAAALRTARRLGYRTVVLDTLPGMTAAIALYRRMGFRPIARYWEHPVADALFFAYRL